MPTHAHPYMGERRDALRAEQLPAPVGAHTREVREIVPEPKSSRGHVNGGASGIEFQGYSVPGVAL